MSVRDEFRMFKDGLKQLYDSSIAYGMKKALKAEQAKMEMTDKIKALEKANKELRKKIGELETEIDDTIQMDRKLREELV